MSCYHPIHGFYSRALNKNKKKYLVLDKSESDGRELTVPCGQCIGCRLAYSRSWAIRCIHESKNYNENAFLTLTYSEENLPQFSELNINHHQLFLKRLRKSIAPKKIRYFHCGEYGDELKRPHYHTLLFNHQFDDLELLKNHNGNPIYTSDTLDNLWGLGYCFIGEVTVESAAYVARYILKKQTGKNSDEHYMNIDITTGIYYGQKQPEYCTMSRRPGIGNDYIKNNIDDVYPRDEVIYPSKNKYYPIKPPRYYDTFLESKDIETFKKIKKTRKKKALENTLNETFPRRLAREKVQKAKAKQLTRNLEENYL